MVERVLVAVVPAVVVVAVAWSSGGYFPRSWGAILLLEAIALASVGLLSSRVELGVRPALVVGGLLGLAVWQLASRAWTVAPDAAFLEAERTLVYAGAAAAAYLVVRRELAGWLVVSVFVGAGAVVTGGLVEHTLRAEASGARLELPIGYQNAVGILATTTLLIGLALSAEGPAWRRALGAVATPVAAAVLYLTLSRGSILAAALGVVVLAATTRPSGGLGRMIVVGLVALGGVAVAARLGSFDRPDASRGEVASLLGLAALSVAAAAIARTSLAVPVPRVTRRVVLGVGAIVVAGVAVGLVLAAAREVRQLRATPAIQQEGAGRLLSTSTSSRSEYWRVAADMVESAPLLGEGAGGFERVWLRDRPALLFVRDAHNLYLEALAELGPVGLALLLVALLTPLVGARVAARDHVGRAALAAYAALLAHAVLDWDWELPAVTLCTVLLGVALVRLGAPPRTRALTAPVRAALVGSAAVLGAVAFVVHVGNGAAAEANDALDRGDASTAVREADRARRFAPWAAEPWQLLGEAELAAGSLDAARTQLRRAVREDPDSWRAWLSLALATGGTERERALEKARAENPLAPELAAVRSSPADP